MRLSLPVSRRRPLSVRFQSSPQTMLRAEALDNKRKPRARPIAAKTNRLEKHPEPYGLSTLPRAESDIPEQLGAAHQHHPCQYPDNGTQNRRYLTNLSDRLFLTFSIIGEFSKPCDAAKRMPPTIRS